MKIPLTQLSFVAIALPLFLLGCKDDTNQTNVQGLKGADGLASLVRQRQLATGSNACNKGGLMIESGHDTNQNGVLDDSEIHDRQAICNGGKMNTQMHFNRIATFAVCAQLGSDCDSDLETAAEIVASSQDGMTLIYSNSPAQQVGFIDIADPAAPVGLGALGLAAEPTSVAVVDAHALVAVNRSENYVDVAGSLEIVEIATRRLIHCIDLGGQPDSGPSISTRKRLLKRATAAFGLHQKAAALWTILTGQSTA